MEQINNMIDFVKNITQEQILDVGIALIIIGIFVMLSPIPVSYTHLRREHILCNNRRCTGIIGSNLWINTRLDETG